MRTALFAATLTALVVAALWALERSTHGRLLLERDAAVASHQKLLALTAEHERLRALQLSVAEFAELEQLAKEQEGLRREIAARTDAPRPSLSVVGEWKACEAWENRGQSTPQDAVETALWAAAGGDTARFESVVELNPEARAGVTAAFAQLPPHLRQTYASPEALAAAASMKNVSATAAQISWCHAADDVRAVVGLLLHEPSASGTPRSGSFGDPTVPRLIVLSLHRAAGGWRLVMPADGVASLVDGVTQTGR